MEQALYWLVGALGVPVINFIKNKLELGGRGAMWLTAAVSFVLGAAALLLNRQLDFSKLSGPEGLMAAFGQVLAAATLAYKLLTE